MIIGIVFLCPLLSRPQQHHQVLTAAQQLLLLHQLQSSYWSRRSCHKYREWPCLLEDQQLEGADDGKVRLVVGPEGRPYRQQRLRAPETVDLASSNIFHFPFILVLSFLLCIRLRQLFLSLALSRSLAVSIPSLPPARRPALPPQPLSLSLACSLSFAILSFFHELSLLSPSLPPSLPPSPLPLSNTLYMSLSLSLTFHSLMLPPPSPPLPLPLPLCPCLCLVLNCSLFLWQLLSCNFFFDLPLFCTLPSVSLSLSLCLSLSLSVPLLPLSVRPSVRPCRGRWTGNAWLTFGDPTRVKNKHLLHTEEQWAVLLQHARRRRVKTACV